MDFYLRIYDNQVQRDQRSWNLDHFLIDLALKKIHWWINWQEKKKQ